MMDLIYILIMVLFFVVCWQLTKACDTL